ncbi:hypothetical protein K523DRAFT_418787 [Schizophyllum commune Tattone D]|nr:hypothetical protein K523DRAFT_418787 [Schizophyllum commune Tattone D]
MPQATASGAPPLPSAPIAPPATSLPPPAPAFPIAPAPRVKRKGTAGDVRDALAKKARPAAGTFLNPFNGPPPAPSSSAHEPPVDPQLLREHMAAHVPTLPDSALDSQGTQKLALKGVQHSEARTSPIATSLGLQTPQIIKLPGATVTPQMPRPPRASTVASTAAPALPSRAPTPSYNPSLPAGPVTVTAMPQSVRDKLSDIEDRIDNMELSRTSFAPATELASLRTRLATLEEAHQCSVDDSRLELDELRAAQSVLASAVDAQAQELARLHELVVDVNARPSQLEQGEDTYPIKSEAITVKIKQERGQTKDDKEKNNLFNAAMRGVFLLAMGMPVGTKNKNLALPIVVEGGGWVARSIESPPGSVVEASQVLRPDWAKSWGLNTAWQDKLVRFARTKVPEIQPMITADYMLQKSDADLTTRMGTVYKAMRLCWQANQVASLNVPPARLRGPARTAAEQTVIGKRKSRKTRKGQKRREVLSDPTEFDQASTKDWLWLVQDSYTSTDESGGEADQEAIDPTSDDEGGRKRVTNRVAPWVTRPPTYRGSTVTAFINMLDKKIEAKAEATGKTSHARVKGDAKDVALPRFTVKDAAFRIPRWAVDTTWLAAHPKDEVAISVAGIPPSGPHVGTSTSGETHMGRAEGFGEVQDTSVSEGEESSGEPAP